MPSGIFSPDARRRSAEKTAQEAAARKEGEALGRAYASGNVDRPRSTAGRKRVTNIGAAPMPTPRPFLTSPELSEKLAAVRTGRHNMKLPPEETERQEAVRQKARVRSKTIITLDLTPLQAQWLKAVCQNPIGEEETPAAQDHRCYIWDVLPDMDELRDMWRREA